MSVRLLLLSSCILAGCLPSERYPLDLKPETESLVYLVVPRCEGRNVIDARGGCKSTSQQPRVFTSPSNQTLAFNLGPDDRVFVGEYPYPEAAVDIPDDRMLEAEAHACPERPFPPPIGAWSIDLASGQRAFTEPFPSAWTLPEFDYAACFGAGGCLGFGGDGVAICKLDCTVESDPALPAPPDAPAAPSEGIAVEVCPNGWFDRSLAGCGFPASCDFEGWPMSPPAGALYVDSAAPGPAFLGTRAAPFGSIEDAAPMRPSALVLRAGDLPYVPVAPLDWSVELVGCRTPDQQRYTTFGALGAPALSVAAAGVTISATSILFNNRIEVAAGSVVLRASAIHIGPGMARPGLSLAQGATAMLTEVGVIDDSGDAGIDLGPGTRLDGETVSVGGDGAGLLGHGASVTISNLTVRDGGVEVDQQSTLSLTGALIHTPAGHDGVAIDASPSVLTDVEIDGSAGAAIRGVGLRIGRSEVQATDLWIADGWLDGVEVDGGLVLHWNGGGAVNLSTALCATDSEIHVDGILVDSVTDTGLRLVGSRAELVSLSIASAGEGVNVESSSVTSARTEIRTVGGPALRFVESSATCADLVLEGIGSADAGVLLERGGARKIPPGARPDRWLRPRGGGRRRLGRARRRADRFDGRRRSLLRRWRREGALAPAGGHLRRRRCAGEQGRRAGARPGRPLVHRVGCALQRRLGGPRPRDLPLGAPAPPVLRRRGRRADRGSGGLALG